MDVTVGPVSGNRSPCVGARFELGEHVGGGAFGEVHRGVDRETGLVVAIKRLHPHLVDDGLERLWREARLLAQIESPYVVRYVAHGFDADDRACLVLEWLEGRDVGQLSRACKLSVEEATELVRQAALGLGALHAAGIVHRDVKPGNFFAVEDESPRRIKLLDLGVARADELGETTGEGEILGTPTYMSPEQARGDREIGPASDIYSLGVVLYQLLSGRRPFTGADPFAVLAKILLEEAPPLRSIVPHLSPALDRVVERAMQKEPRERFASAEELAQALSVAPVSADRAPPGLDETPTLQVRAAVLGATREQRVVSALFADFGASRAGAPPEAVEPAMDAFTTLVARYQGSAFRMRGDRAIAVFGASHASGDDAACAARTALALVSTAAAPKAAAIRPRLAITTGRAVPSASGLGGSSVERGTAEVERCEPGSIRIDAMTARALGPAFLIEERPSGNFLVGVRDAVGAIGPVLLGKETPLVGRADALAALEAAFEECARGPAARVILVTGDPGIGKSRLRYEFLRRREATEILLGRGDPLRAGAPFGILSDVIRRAAGILDGDDRKIARQKLRARLGVTLGGRAHPRATLFLGELCGLPFPDATSQALRVARSDPMLMGDGMRRAFEDWLAAESAARPVILVLEDFHHGDAATQSFVEGALRNLRRSPILVVALARPEVHREFPGLWSQNGPREIGLGPLDDDASAALVRHALPAATAEQRAFILNRAEGNPFYLEELVRAVASGIDGALPETALGILQARLDALGTEGKLVLRVASVFGMTFWRDAVAALLGPHAMPPDSLDRCLYHLTELEVIARRSVPRKRHDEYVFRSALVRDAAYATLVDDDLERAHRLAVGWLERVSERDPGVLAEHCARAGEPGRAIGHCLRGAVQALEGNDLDEAIRLAERGVSWGAEGESLGLLRLVQAEAHRWKGSFAEAAESGEHAAARLPMGHAAWFRAVAEVATAMGRLGRYDEALRWSASARDAEPIPDVARLSLADITRQDGGFDSVFPASEESFDGAPDADAKRAKIICLARAVLQLSYASRGDHAAGLLREAEALAHPLDSVEPVARARIHQARALAALFAGDPARYVAEHEAALAAFEAASDERSACQELVSLGSGYAELGQYARAETALTKAIVSAERLGLGHIGPWAQQNLAHVLSVYGRLEEADPMAQAALAAGLAGGDRRLAGGARVYAARIALARGDAVTAQRESAAADELLESAPALRAAATATLARALLSLGDLDAALLAAIRATACIEALGEGKMGESESAVRLALVEVLAARGDDSARDALEVAHRRLRERAGRIRDAAIEESFLGAVPDHARTLELVRVAAADPKWPRAGG